VKLQWIEALITEFFASHEKGRMRAKFELKNPSKVAHGVGQVPLVH